MILSVCPVCGLVCQFLRSQLTGRNRSQILNPLAECESLRTSSINPKSQEPIYGLTLFHFQMSKSPFLNLEVEQLDARTRFFLSKMGFLTVPRQYTEFAIAVLLSRGFATRNRLGTVLGFPIIPVVVVEFLDPTRMTSLNEQHAVVLNCLKQSRPRSRWNRTQSDDSYNHFLSGVVFRPLS